MLSNIYHTHGYFCASHPWEIIIGSVTVTTCLLSVSLFTAGSRICGWNYVCENDKEEESSDLMILTVTRCLAVMYLYLQFRNIRQLGSKYLLGISGSLMIISSFVLTAVIVKVFGGNISGLSEALPFFLLLVDLSKACALAQYALKSKTQEEVQKNIAEGISSIGPAITLDSICEVLVIGVGTLSDVKQLDSMCCYGCLSVVAHYLAFMVFYPACLSLIIQITRARNNGRPLLQLQQLARVLENEEEKKPNPVIQHIKMIMSAGLMIVHIHSRFITEEGEKSRFSSLLTTTELLDRDRQPEMPLVQFYLLRMLTHHIDYTFMFVLAVFLTVKYVFYDDHIEEELTRKLEEASQTRRREISDSLRDGTSQTTESMDNILQSRQDEIDFKQRNTVSFTQPTETIEFKFSIGDDSDSEEEDKSSDKGVQTDNKMSHYKPLQRLPSLQPPRSIEKCLELLNSDNGPSLLTDEEIIVLVKSRHIPAYKLEIMLNDFERGVVIRREMLLNSLKQSRVLDNLPYSDYAYEYVNGACCENVIGYMPVPVGVAGPLLLNGKLFHVPMATTEGCLVASTNRGCKALEQSGGVTSVVINDGMTRAPVVRFSSAKRASEVKKWLEDKDNLDKVKESFDMTSRFARLTNLHIVQAGKLLYIRFIAVTGDAMGMNMLSKGSEKALAMLSVEFADMEILSLSGNFCTDKKAAAVNWLEGRGKSVVCEAVIPAHIVEKLLKTTVQALVDLNISKNLVGSAMAGSIGGFNAHAANIVTAIFIATGQDPAQNVTSSNCITLMEATGDNYSDLRISCTMPCLEVGTIGGGTVLPPQSACLEMLGVCGSCAENPGENAKLLASIICGTVLAGELSLMSALAAGHLVRSHLKHNRSTVNVLPNQSLPNSSDMSQSPQHSYVLPNQSLSSSSDMSQSSQHSHADNSHKLLGCSINIIKSDHSISNSVDSNYTQTQSNNFLSPVCDSRRKSCDTTKCGKSNENSNELYSDKDLLNKKDKIS